MRIFISLITHSWKMFRRSELFGKSIAVIIMLGFMAFFLLLQLNLAGRQLPSLLNEHFPARSPGGWVYGYLLLLMVVDFSARLFIQSLSAQQVRPYMHLPVSHASLTFYWMLRSWLHPLNIYLLFFFLPFIRVTINPETSSQELGLLGIFMLTAINQGLLMWLKSSEGNRMRAVVVTGSAAGLIMLAYTFFNSQTLDFSRSIFIGFVNGDVVVFTITAFLILLFHYLAYRQSKQGFYTIFGQGSQPKAVAGDSRIERIIAAVPVFGPHWLVEWRLVSRSKRSKFNFFFMIPIGVLASFYIASRADGYSGAFMVIIFMIAGSYGNFHLQHAFSWESHHFDFLATRHIDMGRFIAAKYNFYLAYACLQILIILPVLLWYNLSLAMLFGGMFLYACGFGYYFYLRTGISTSTRFDANGRSTFNLEGVTGMKFLQSFLLFFSIIPFLILSFILNSDHILALLLSITGLIFILTQKWWIRSLARKFNNRKYLNLNLYRQK